MLKNYQLRKSFREFSILLKDEYNENRVKIFQDRRG